MKPWSEEAFNADLDDDEIEDLWAQTKPEDFYFMVENSGHAVITPKEYYDQNGCMYDQHLLIDHILPKELGEEMEGAYSFEVSPEEMRDKLLKLGFVEHTLQCPL